MPNMMVSGRVLNEEEKLSLLKLHQGLGLDKNSRFLSTAIYTRVYCDNLVPKVLELFGQREGPERRSYFMYPVHDNPTGIHCTCDQ